MAQTILASRGSDRPSGPNPRYDLRLAVLATLLMVATFFVIWINSSIGTKMSRLRSDFAAIQSERFYVGVHLRVSVRTLNNSLLTFYLSQDADDAPAFAKFISRDKTQPAGKKLASGEIRQVRMLGVEKPLSFSRDEKGLTVQLPDRKPCDFAVVLKISAAK